MNVEISSDPVLAGEDVSDARQRKEMTPLTIDLTTNDAWYSPGLLVGVPGSSGGTTWSLASSAAILTEAASTAVAPAALERVAEQKACTLSEVRTVPALGVASGSGLVTLTMGAPSAVPESPLLPALPPLSIDPPRPPVPRTPASLTPVAPPAPVLSE